MVFLHDKGLSQAESDLLDQLVKSYKKNQIRFDEALNILSKRIKEELSRDDSEINRLIDETTVSPSTERRIMATSLYAHELLEEIIERVNHELLHRRKKVVPNLSNQDIQKVSEEIRKVLSI